MPDVVPDAASYLEYKPWPLKLHSYHITVTFLPLTGCVVFSPVSYLRQLPPYKNEVLTVPNSQDG